MKTMKKVQDYVTPGSGGGGGGAADRVSIHSGVISLPETIPEHEQVADDVATTTTTAAAAAATEPPLSSNKDKNNVGQPVATATVTAKDSLPPTSQVKTENERAVDVDSTVPESGEGQAGAVRLVPPKRHHKTASAGARELTVSVEQPAVVAPAVGLNKDSDETVIVSSDDGDQSAVDADTKHNAAEPTIAPVATLDTDQVREEQGASDQHGHQSADIAVRVDEGTATRASDVADPASSQHLRSDVFSSVQTTTVVGTAATDDSGTSVSVDVDVMKPQMTVSAADSDVMTESQSTQVASQDDMPLSTMARYPSSTWQADSFTPTGTSPADSRKLQTVLCTSIVTVAVVGTVMLFAGWVLGVIVTYQIRTWRCL
jgi:hypothetical protein